MDYKDLKLPNHLGIIMDGNGRWATSRGLSRSAGHKAGYKNLKELLYYIYEKEIKYVSLYAFSTENFKRAEEEVNYLMDLFLTAFAKELKTLKKLGARIVFSGRKENLPDSVWTAMKNMEEETKDFTKGTLNICLNYGGQYEVVDMVKNISELVENKKISIEDINTELVEKNLYNDLPPLDFIIRTSGEMRTSNFMIYQSAYAEYYFPEVLFPDFNKDEFDKAIVAFNKRNRRFGGN